jgi:hypothetical protein
LPPPRFGISSRIRFCPPNSNRRDGRPDISARRTAATSATTRPACGRSFAATRCPMRRFLGSRGTALR